MATSKLIGTHNGKFHCDEVFACYMLKKLPDFKDHTILRTRDPELLKDCEIVVDVGGVYNHDERRYDHHQRTFVETMRTVKGLDFDIKLSSAGLIYAHYGRLVIAVIIKSLEKKSAESNEANNGAIISSANNGASHNDVLDVLYSQLYKNFVASVDAIDNGIKQFESGVPRYHLSSTLDGRVGSCNPAWNEPTKNADECFQQAMKIVGEEFEAKVSYLYRSWLPAKNIVETAIRSRERVHPSGKIIEFEEGAVPWKEHFFGLEKELGLEEVDISLVIYADSTDKGSFRVQAIPISENSSFDNRCGLPVAWRGIRDLDLAATSNIPGAIFVHASGFIGGAKSRDGALLMAIAALKEAKKI